MISLVTMSQGNPIALKRTIESVVGVCDEVIYGDLCVLKEDREEIMDGEYSIPVHFVKLPFNYIFKNGFSATLNTLSHYGKNNLCIYLNAGEVIESSLSPILETVQKNSSKNCFFIDHATEKHRWFRMWDKRHFKWDGLIHEEIILSDKEYGSKPFHKPIFRFADTEKDLVDPYRARMMNDVKEIVYFTIYNRLVDHPEEMGVTSMGWLAWSKDQYEANRTRLEAKGKRIDAFRSGDLEMYLDDTRNNPAFQKEVYESSLNIEFQGDKKFLLPYKTIKHRSVEFRYKSHPEFWKNIEGWESETFDVLDRFIGPGKMLLDIGAWNGVLSIYAHLLGGKFLAVEPDERAWGQMLRNFELYEGLSSDMIRAFAIANHCGEVTLRNKVDHFGDSESSLLQRHELEQTMSVPAMTLEGLVSGMKQKPDLIKIDTEGAEILIIPSSIKILKQLNCPLYLSLHPYWFPNGDADTKKIMDALAEVYDMSKAEPMIHNQYLFLP